MPFAKRDTSSCARGGFYKTPTVGESVDSMQPLTVSWDTTCLNSTLLDLYLFVPAANNSQTHTFTGISNAAGTYNATILPRWWGSTASQTLQITLVESGQDLSTNLLPAGPVFYATYTAPPAGQSVPAAADTNIQDNSTVTVVDGGNAPSGAISSHKLSGGKVAAAVIMPLLVIALGILVWLKMTRKKQQQKRAEWNEKVDQRMSTISQDWKPMSASAANAAIRNSVYSTNAGPNRYSFAFSGLRPVSIFDSNGQPIDPNSFSEPAMPPAHIRPNYKTINSAFENRVSRVSFAADTRPSGESRRSRKLGGGNTQSTASVSFSPEEFSVPSLPDPKPRVQRKDSLASEDGNLDGTMSPRQTSGALKLSDDEIKRRVSQRMSRASVRSAKSFEDDAAMMPALTLMRNMEQPDVTGASVAYPALAHRSGPSGQLTLQINPIAAPAYDAYNYNYNQYANYNSQYAFASAVPPTPSAFASAPAIFDAGEDTPTQSSAFAVQQTVQPLTAPAGVGAGVGETDVVFEAPMSPSAPSTGSSQFGGMATPAIPASFMSPDDMLKAYAARQSTMPATPSSINTNTPSLNINNTGSMHTRRMSSTALGQGVGFAGAISYPVPNPATMAMAQAGRTLIPAGPGAISPARGAYGVVEP